MKLKKIRLLVVAMHVVALAGFSLLQGCATGNSPVDWLTWPYNTPSDEPLLIPADEYNDEYSDDSVILPPAVYPTEPVEGTDYIPTEPMVGESQTYIVRKGDTLSSIASMYGTTWKKLAEYNSLSNPNKLLVGQKIQIPGGASAAPAPVVRLKTPTTTTTAPASSSKAPIKQGSSYVIQRGDSLSSIASRSGLTVNEIKAANALDSNRIIAGKSLSIPRKGDVSVSAYSAAKPVAEPATVSAPPSAAPEPAPLADIAPLEPAESAPVYDHVLYPGETLEDVARQYGSSQEEIMMLNGITSADAVKPGTKLLVPIPE